MSRLVPSVPVQLDKERHLRLDNAALLRAERELSRVWQRKISIIQVLIDPATLGLNDVSVLLYCGVLHEDPDVSLGQVQDAMTLQAFPGYVEALYKAWTLATAPAEGAPPVEGEGPFPTLSPGNATGVSPASNLG